MNRWKEEVALVEEEQQHVSAALEHQAKIWEACVRACVGMDCTLEDGVQAYVQCQSNHVCRCMAEHFRQLWEGEREIPDDDLEEDREPEGEWASSTRASEPHGAEE